MIDAHTHVFAESQREARATIARRDAAFAEMYADPSAKLATSEDLGAAMARAGVDGAVVAGFAFAHEADIAAQNEALLALAGDARFAPLATVNLAHTGWRVVAEEALAHGARGVGELRPHNQGWLPEGGAAHELCELAGAAGVPLLWHVSEPVGHLYPGKRGGISPVELIELAASHPQTSMVAAHLGGGLSFYLNMPEVRQAAANIYFDSAAVPLLYAMQSVTQLVALAGPGSVMFASDYPLLTPLRQLERIRAVLPAEAAQAVLGGNADRLYFG